MYYQNIQTIDLLIDNLSVLAPVAYASIGP